MEMNTIFDSYKMATSDVIFASIQCNGRTLASIKQTNFSSIEDVMRCIVSMAGQFYGMAQVQVRNMTQGWRTAMPVASQHRIALPRITPVAPVMHSGMQYTIPW